MTKIIPFMIFPLSLIIYIITLISSSSAIISNKRLCYDEKCSEPVSLAKTLLMYYSNDEDILSFHPNIEVKVFSKSAGNRPDLWGVEILGKRGYVPKKMIREYSILKRELSFEVPTKSIDNDDDNVPKNEIPQENSTSEEVIEKLPEESVINSSPKDLEHSQPIPENVSPSYEVIDGTTIPLAIDESPQEYSSQSIDEETASIEEEPVLSVHPSLVSSTISFVSQVFDKVTQQLEKMDNTANEAKKEEINKDETKGENLENSSQSPNENLPEGEDKNVPQADEENLPQTEDQNISQTEDKNVLDSENKTVEENEGKEEKEEEVKKEEKMILDETVSEERENEQHNEEDEEIEGDEETEGEEEVEEEQETKEDIHPPEEQISKEENLATQAEIETQFETEDSNLINNNNSSDELKSANDSPIEKQIPHPDLSTIELTTETIVTDQVPLTDKQETFILNEKTDTQEINEKNNDNLPPPTTIETENNSKNNIGEIDEISHVETDNISLNTSDEIMRENDNVNIVNSENILLDSSSTDDSNNDLAKDDSNNLNTNNSMEMKNDSIEMIEHFSSETNNISIDNNNEFSNETNNFSIDNNIDFSNANNISANEDNINEEEKFVADDDNNNNVISHENDFVSNNDTLENLEPHFHDELEPRKEILATEQATTFNELPSNRNLLNFDESSHFDSQESQSDKLLENDIPESTEKLAIFNKHDSEEESAIPLVLPPEVCVKDSNCPLSENIDNKDDNVIANVISMGKNYWEFLAYLLTTSVTILVFSLGYYYIENARRDNKLIGRINKLEKELMISSKECAMLNENLTCTKTKSILDNFKLNSIEDESFGSNEMVASLKADLEAAQNTNLEMEDQVATLEKELESATEAGLELERMLRELLSSNKEDNPLAQSIEDLQARLNAQQAENEALTNALNLKKQESEGLSSDLFSFTKKYEELEVEVKRLEDELKTQGNMKIYMEQTMEDKIQRLEFQMRETMEERSQLRQELKAKELEINHLLEVIDQDNSNNLDFDKLYDSVHAKAEALQLAEERDELRVKLIEAENTHKSLEALMKSAKEEVLSLNEECKTFEKEKKDAETKLEVLSNFFKEKEAQRQKEEALWLEKQGEVSSTVERIHTMQNEIQNYKQQIEILKREIVDQEREYKSQIGALETKAHEHWVVARQNERRLEELKAESGQLRNRLTIVEKSMNDPDPEVKLHRMEANGETATSPSLFLGPESSNSPIMFSNTSGVPPPPPPSYMFGPGFHPYLPPPPPGPGGLPPFDVGQRPPPLGGRLSSPPPLPLQPPSGRYENTGSPPPLSPPLRPHHLHHHPHHHFDRHRSPPPPHFNNDHIHSHPPPPPPPSLLPIHPLGHSHNWGEESLPPMRNSGLYPHQRDQRLRNHKGSLHSSGESLDKSHHSGKV
ncbi:transport and Golgi organization protein 1 isoform X3 [Leptopilina boulardi]|uniref:transport and Golgi organization protein 1 isoform X3 n=1 Tax=Leptopilina boulardi TaxID=63433 RepID=UPI0021F5DF59|nr:transport and Golgi organization protein 1 isoform X3 [Leptopilina boulardi]